jgi:tRNA synthetases class I (E and Q), anti-codon binding domain.
VISKIFLNISELTQFRNYARSTPGKDWEKFGDGDVLRLKDLCVVVKSGNVGDFDEREVTKDHPLKIIHWCPQDSERFSVYKPDGTVDDGLLEPLALDYNGIAQFERYGYVNKTADEAFFLYR